MRVRTISSIGRHLAKNDAIAASNKAGKRHQLALREVCGREKSGNRLLKIYEVTDKKLVRKAR